MDQTAQSSKESKQDKSAQSHLGYRQSGQILEDNKPQREPFASSSRIAPQRKAIRQAPSHWRRAKVRTATGFLF